jgi:surfactin synthase thioesterase subunit
VFVSSRPFSVLCFPFAGAGAGFFRPWADYNTEWATFVPVQLPGREERLFEDLCVSMAKVVDECVAQILPAVRNGRFALFGHSFGAIAAYETARYLVQNTDCRPAHLVVSGAAAPFVQRHTLGLSGLPDDEFITRLTSLVGYDHEALHDPELRELLLPALRCDLAITDEYVASDTAPLPMPVSGLRGANDTLVSAAEIALWALATSKEFRYIEMAGDHMYLTGDWMPLAAQIDHIAGGTIKREGSRVGGHHA